MPVKDDVEIMEIIRVVHISNEDLNFARVLRLFVGEDGEIEHYALSVDNEWIKIEHGHYPNITKLSVRSATGGE